MKQDYSKIRNEALASAFEYMGYIKHWGERHSACDAEGM